MLFKLGLDPDHLSSESTPSRRTQANDARKALKFPEKNGNGQNQQPPSIPQQSQGPQNPHHTHRGNTNAFTDSGGT